MSQQSQEAVFYVSLSGDDSWSGKFAEPNSSETDGPFVTLEKARDAIRDLKRDGQLPDGCITVYIRGGNYSISKTLKLTAEDSGAESSPIIWQAYPGEEVHFIGGKVITDFEPVDDLAVLGRIDKAYHDQIYSTNLKAQCITDYGEIDPKSGNRMELFFNNEYMTIARYPNEGWLHVGEVPQIGEKLIDLRTDGITLGQHYGRFKYEGERPDRWAESDDIWVHGYWVYDWSDSFHRVVKLDKEKKEIYPSEPYHGYGYRQGQRYYFLNILEELDSPGEWHLDRKSGILYFWPPSSVDEGVALVTTLKELFLSLEETSYVTFQGIIFEASRASAVSISGGTNNKIAGCTFRNIAGNVVTINGGTENGVIGCDIYDIAGSAISISGGDRKTLTPGYNYATNNHIHHYCRVIGIGGAINISGVGNRVAHNLIHDAPHHAINFSGNEHVIEFNEIHDVLKETDDAGAIYSGRDWTFRGNVIRHNYIHHIKGPGRWGLGVYFDDNYSSALVYGNVFYKAGVAVHIGGGRDCIVENNIFVESQESVNIGVRPREWLRHPGHRMYEKLEEVNYNKPPYSIKYPKLATILDDGDPGFPAGNVIVRNVSYGGRWMGMHSLDFEDVEVKNNLIADPEIVNWRKPDAKESVAYKYGDQEIIDILAKYDNKVIDGDPGFVDMENKNFQLKDDSPAWKLGFKRIPIEKIGLYKDEYRTTLTATK
jgi:hypothetical protein